MAPLVDTLPDVIGIVGSRGPDLERGRPVGWTDYNLILNLCARIAKKRHEAGWPATIVSGGAPSGVDRHVRIACRNLSFCFGEHLIADPTSVDCPRDHFHEIPAQWNGPDGKGRLNRNAGFERNNKLIRHCGLVIALFAPGQTTPGTADVCRKAREYEIPLLVYQEGRWHE
jgi:hypothetical protein